MERQRHGGDEFGREFLVHAIVKVRARDEAHAAGRVRELLTPCSVEVVAASEDEFAAERVAIN